MRKSTKGVLILTLTALIWGTAFVAQNSAAEHVPTFIFIFLRYLIGSAVLLPVVFFSDRKKTKEQKKAEWGKTTLLGGFFCGIALLLGSTFQQLGFTDPAMTSGKSAFVTALYIIFTPLLGLFIGKKVPLRVWISVAVAGIGMYFLCLHGEASFSYGDLYTLACALFFTFHILVVDRYSKNTDCVKLSIVQFITAGTIGGIISLCTETVALPALTSAALPILYAGVFSSGIAFTLQTVGQRTCPPAVAPIVMSLESVFGALSGWVILNEKMSLIQILGCVLIFAAIIFTQTGKEPEEAANEAS